MPAAAYSARNGKQVLPFGQDDRKNLARFAYFAACAALLSCAAAGSGPIALDGKLALGTWGGDNAGMIVSDTAMHLHVGCTYGDVSGRIALAACTIPIAPAGGIALPHDHWCDPGPHLVVRGRYKGTE